MNTAPAFVRTPEQAFVDLPDYPFAPNYMDLQGLRMHYLDEGPRDEKTIFLFHGQPSWNYLYRHMIPLLTQSGYRVIAPDLIGFGKSDKPIEAKEHTYQAHVDWMTLFVRKLGLQHAAAFMQDWGGMIGLRVLAQEPEWLSRLILSNTAFADTHPVGAWFMPRMLKMVTWFAGQASLQDLQRHTSFGNWSSYFRHAETLELGEVMQLLTSKQLTPHEMAAYDAPFIDKRFYAGPRTMPQIVAHQLNTNRHAWKQLEHWKHPVLTLFSDQDPFLKDAGYDVLFQKRFQGAKNQPHTTIQGASHFLQEDRSTALATHITNWLQQTQF